MKLAALETSSMTFFLIFFHSALCHKFGSVCEKASHATIMKGASMISTMFSNVLACLVVHSFRSLLVVEWNEAVGKGL
jgi:hypothetical protein